MKPSRAKKWAVQWRSDNTLDGRTRRLQGDFHGLSMLFHTRRECRAHIEQEYGYIRTRSDLRAEPHGWKMPVATRVLVTVTAMENGQ